MKVKYDKETNAAYLQMPSKKPDGAVEVEEGVIFIPLKITRSWPSRYSMLAGGFRLTRFTNWNWPVLLYDELHISCKLI